MKNTFRRCTDHCLVHMALLLQNHRCRQHILFLRSHRSYKKWHINHLYQHSIGQVLKCIIGIWLSLEDQPVHRHWHIEIHLRPKHFHKNRKWLGNLDLMSKYTKHIQRLLRLPHKVHKGFSLQCSRTLDHTEHISMDRCQEIDSWRSQRHMRVHQLLAWEMKNIHHKWTDLNRHDNQCSCWLKLNNQHKVQLPVQVQTHRHMLNTTQSLLTWELSNSEKPWHKSINLPKESCLLNK